MLEISTTKKYLKRSAKISIECSYLRDSRNLSLTIYKTNLKLPMFQNR